MLRGAPPRRNKRAFSTLPNCFLYIVKLLSDPQETHYFYDSDSNRVNPPTFQKYILFPHNNLRRIGLPKGLDNISPKTSFCTN